ncbi:hypothetical protein [Vibrio phage VpV262]|uniref:Uncharacterized protein n=1 Tax=Vibrio phage VpV262 TaxID=2907796 RepID=Q8LT85_9CAUD|nr:hypothetical protein VpV262p14 [Vibrio phage VpV262]AAM28362.1 hypothetical protein [Vibrio phage VpV262]
MELQTIFNMVLQHLARQDHGASDFEHGCAYRAEGGRKCAVGYLLSESAYHDDVEGEVIGDEHINAAVEESIGELPYGGYNVLSRLQTLHDGDYDMVCSGEEVSGMSKERRVLRMVSAVEELADAFDLIVPRAFYDWIKKYGYERQ